MRVAAGFVVYKRVDQAIHYLLLQTSYGIHHWTPPKGHVDPGESEKDTAIRETTEESGLTPADLNIRWDFKKTMNYLVKGQNKRVIYWLAELKRHDAPIKLSDEHQNFKWSTLDEACRLAAYDEMKQLLTEAEAFLNSDA